MTRALVASMRAAGRIAAFACSLAACAPALGEARAATTPPFPKTNVSTDLTDIWWPDDEPGWGIQLIQNADLVFATMFVYGPDMEPLFFVAVLQKLVGADTWTGDLFQANGTFFAESWDPADRAEFQAGAMTFTLTGIGTGTLVYNVGPSNIVKTLNRQPLKLEDNSGDYRMTHTWSSAGAGCSDTDAYSPAAGPVNGNLAIERIAGDVATVSLSWQLAPVDICAMTAGYTQVGRLGAYSGALTCSPSGRSGTLTFYEIANRIKMLTGRYIMEWDYGCVRSGQFAAIMATP